MLALIVELIAISATYRYWASAIGSHPTNVYKRLDQ